MRVIFDANVLVSFLLSPTDSHGTIKRIVDAAFANRFTLLLPAEVLSELRNAGSIKPHILARIREGALTALLDALDLAAETLPMVADQVVEVVRDRNDNYLITAAHLFDAAVLVSGDKDLLVLRDKVTAFQIMSPREFLELIER